ncbi:MAG: hypothetical protein RR348_02185, partial [Clostridia bacterium]
MNSSMMKNARKTDFAFGGENSNARMPFEKKAENHDVFTISNGIATGDNNKSRSLKAEGTYLLRLDNISFDYRRIYCQLRSFLEAYDIREIVVSSSENFFSILPARMGVGEEVLIMRILLLNGQLIWTFNVDKLPKGCDNLTFMDVKDEDALNYSVAINSRRDITNCQPILD